MSYKRIYIFIAATLLTAAAHAQFIDLDWVDGDTVAPSYTHSFELGTDYKYHDYSFVMEYPETAPASEKELDRYKVDVNNLTSNFPVDTYIGTRRKKGTFDVSVYPFAKRDGKVIKLLSFKPVIKKSVKPEMLYMQGDAASSLVRRQSRAGAVNAESRYAEHSLLAEGKWVKIRVSKQGIYELSRSSLSSMGFRNPERVRLYGYNLPFLPETNIEDIADDLQEIPLWRKTNGSLLFYSCGTTQLTRSKTSTINFTHRNNTYSNYIYYFLTESADVAPAEFPMIDNGDGTGNEDDGQIISITETCSIVENDAFSFLHSGRQFFDSHDYANGNRQTYRPDLSGLSSRNVTLTVQFAASSNTPSTLNISSDSTTLGTLSIGSKGTYEEARVAYGTYTWRNASTNGSITLTHNRTTGVPGRLDYIRAAFTRNLELKDAPLLFRPQYTIRTQLNTYRISGATASTKVWRITQRETPCEMRGYLKEGNYYVTIEDRQDNWNSQEYIAVNTERTYPSPEYAGNVENQDLHSLRDIDFVIITPANGRLNAQAQRLADAHAAREGMRCIVVRADQIYNEFSSGTPDATAYRRFMKMLYDRAESEADAPKNLLLFGNGFWDNRLITNGMGRLSQDDYLLCYESDNSTSHTQSYVLEEYFALLDDGEGNNLLRDKPDIGVGRITVTNVSEAKTVVDKLIRYINNEETGAWKNTICFMADDGNLQQHMDDAERNITQTRSLFPDIHLRRIYWDAYSLVPTSAGNSYPEATKEINKQMLDGALIMNYTGHGAPYMLSHEKVMHRSNFTEWSSPRLPLWITAACDVSPFDMNEENIGITALVNPKGAAMGMVTTTRTVYSDPNRVLNMNFMRYVLAKKENGIRYTIGEALQNAKADIAGTTGYNNVNRFHFVLLGDPAITLASPSYKVNIDTFNGKSNTQDDETEVEIKAGSVVKVTGHIVDENGNAVEDYNGIVSPVVYDKLESFAIRNNVKEDLSLKGPTMPILTSIEERTKTLYNGSDSISNGKFEFSFPVPLDISYSYESGLLNLYATNNEKTIEANGKFEDFILGGTDNDIQPDNEGPQITLFLNNENFTPGDKVNESPLLFARICDADGINTTGNGVGHDIMAVIDNDPSLTYTLNDYFSTDIGDYSAGSLSYLLTDLPAGKHKLMLRAWDTLNNPASQEIEFEVVKGLHPTIFELICSAPVRNEAVFTIINDRPQANLNVKLEVYDVAGRKVWEMSDQNSSDTGVLTYTWNFANSSSRLNSGVYICKVYISTANGETASKAKKFIVL